MARHFLFTRGPGSSLLVWTVCFHSYLLGVKQGLLRWFFRYIRNSPFVKKKILRALEKTKDVLHQDMLKLMRGKRSADGFDYILTLPNAGAESEDIISKLNEYMTLGKN